MLMDLKEEAIYQNYHLEAKFAKNKTNCTFVNSIKRECLFNRDHLERVKSESLGAIHVCLLLSDSPDISLTSWKKLVWDVF